MELGSKIKSQYDEFTKTRRNKSHKMKFIIFCSLILLVTWMIIDFVYYKELFNSSIYEVKLLQQEMWMNVFSYFY